MPPFATLDTYCTVHYNDQLKFTELTLKLGRLKRNVKNNYVSNRNISVCFISVVVASAPFILSEFTL